MSGSTPYLVAGFALTWGALVVYAWRLEARVDEARGRLERRPGEHGERPGAAAGRENESEPATSGPAREERR